MTKKFLSMFMGSVCAATALAATPPGMVVVEGGEYAPLFNDPTTLNTVQVKGFYIDSLLVSNGEFYDFTQSNPNWSKEQVPTLFADEQYLKHFTHAPLAAQSDPTNSTSQSEVIDWRSQPVTNVSWFSAKAYCNSKNKRLPSVNEWEYAARASADEIDATQNAEFLSTILQWYSQSARTKLPAVDNTAANIWGIHGMHGVVWEMVDDFNSVLVTGESRGDTQLERELFCGAGASASTNPQDYAAFMRYALRSSYEAPYTLESLGFRCAKNLDDNGSDANN